MCRIFTKSEWTNSFEYIFLVVIIIANSDNEIYQTALLKVEKSSMPMAKEAIGIHGANQIKNGSNEEMEGRTSLMGRRMEILEANIIWKDAKFLLKSY